jgi:DNA-binding NtrC family response regulator
MECTEEQAAPLIMAVNGYPVDRNLEQEVLELDGFRVVKVVSGERAEQFVLRERPALVILNLIQLDASARHLVNVMHDQQPRVPVILLTTSPDVADWATEIHADGFLAMPFDLDDLTTLVERTLVVERSGA